MMKSEIQHGYHATVCMPGCILFNYTTVGQGLRPNDGPEVKLSSFGLGLMLIVGWVHHGSTWGFLEL